LSKQRHLTALSEAERDQALARFRVLQPFLDGQLALREIAGQRDLKLRTLQRWAKRYQEQGLAGLARQPRSDRGQRRIDPELRQLIEGLALQKTRPSAAAIHRQVAEMATQYGWEVPSYSCVYDIVRNLDPALVMLAHEGTKAYQQAYDLLYRREAEWPNAIWQADHTPLNIWLLNDDGQAGRPWLTVIEDDFSCCVAGYLIGFEAPNALHTALALRQAIWPKADPHWHICGIPGIFYTDHGSDFTSRHMEQVSADLKIQLIFSMPGMPRGRGRVERFFRTLDQLLLHKFPGYAPEGKPLTPPALTLAEFETLFKAFLLDEYHHRPQKDLPLPPQARWEAGGFLPQLPESLEQLDLLLLTVARTRWVRRDGIHFQRLRYMDPTLAAYVGEDVVIRYDPLDMAEIRVYHRNTFLCRAVCQELAEKTVSLKDIIRARNQRRRELRGTIKDRAGLVQTYLDVHQGAESAPPLSELLSDPVPSKKLKRYHHD
jgi:putative transposase